MAAKKEPSIADGLAIFKDVMKRSTITEFEHVNNVMHGKTAKDVPVVIVPDQVLWNAILNDEELRPHIVELDIMKPESSKVQERITYAQGSDNDGWIDIDPTVMYSGEMVNISIDGFQYQIPINKSLFPVKFKKAEFNNFTYRVYVNPKLTLALRKKFDGPVEGSSFSMVRIFQIL